MLRVAGGQEIMFLMTRSEIELTKKYRRRLFPGRRGSSRLSKGHVAISYHAIQSEHSCDEGELQFGKLLFLQVAHDNSYCWQAMELECLDQGCCLLPLY